jgi:hypothetical protein
VLRVANDTNRQSSAGAVLIGVPLMRLTEDYRCPYDVFADHVHTSTKTNKAKAPKNHQYSLQSSVNVGVPWSRHLATVFAPNFYHARKPWFNDLAPHVRIFLGFDSRHVFEFFAQGRRLEWKRKSLGLNAPRVRDIHRHMANRADVSDHHPHYGISLHASTRGAPTAAATRTIA